MVVEPEDADPDLSVVDELLDDDVSDGELLLPELDGVVEPEVLLELDGEVDPEAPVVPLALVLLDESLEELGVGLCATVVELLLDGEVLLLGVVPGAVLVVVVLRSHPATNAVPRARMAIGRIFMESPVVGDVNQPCPMHIACQHGLAGKGGVEAPLAGVFSPEAGIRYRERARLPDFT